MPDVTVLLIEGMASSRSVRRHLPTAGIPSGPVGVQGANSLPGVVGNDR